MYNILKIFAVLLFALCHSAAFSADAPKSKIVLEGASGMELPIPDANGAEIGAFSFSKIGWITPYRIFLFKVNAVKIPVFENAKLVFAKIPDKKITPADFDFTPMQFAPFEAKIGSVELKTPRAIFTKTKHLVFPKGAKLTSRGMSAETDSLAFDESRGVFVFSKGGKTVAEVEIGGGKAAAVFKND